MEIRIIEVLLYYRSCLDIVLILSSLKYKVKSMTTVFQQPLLLASFSHHFHMYHDN